jgi:hypothetical protein
MDIWQWVKEKLQWIVGGVIVVLAIIFAVKYEKTKIASWKHRTVANHKLDQVRQSMEKTAELKAREEELRRQDELAETHVMLIDNKLQEVAKDVEKRTADEVADRFNELYANDPGID